MKKRIKVLGIIYIFLLINFMNVFDANINNEFAKARYSGGTVIFEDDFDFLSPEWVSYHNDSPPVVSIENGIVSVNDSDSSETEAISRTDIHTSGGNFTVEARVRVDFNSSGDIFTNTFDVFYRLANGYYGLVAIKPDSVMLRDESGPKYMLNTSVFHVYRVTVADGGYQELYVDNNPHPVLTRSRHSTTSKQDRLFIGGQDVFTGIGYVDYIRVYEGVIPPTDEEGLVGCWHFDEGSENIAHDSSGNDNHGTIYGATWVDGICGKALSFDGSSDYISINGFTGNFSEITVEAWVKVIDYPPRFGKILDFGDDLSDEGLSLQPNGKRLALQSRNVDGVKGFDFDIDSGGGGATYYSSSSTNIFFFLTGVWKKGEYVKLFVNGTLVDDVETNTIKNINIFDWDNCIIGRRFEKSKARNTYDPFNGIIDEICIYSYALSTSEIQTHYQEVVDNTPPETTHTTLGKEGCNNWFTSDVLIILNVSDDKSGVAYTLYQINEGNYQTYDDAFTIQSEGITNLSYYSVDNFGNKETTKTVTIKIDKSPPDTLCYLTSSTPNGDNGWYTEKVRVILSSDDGGISGINGTWYRLDGGDWQGYMDYLNIQDDGDHIIEYYSVDIACNAEAIKSVEIKIDTVNPAISLKKPKEDTFYIFDRELIRLPFGTLILGKVTIEAQATDETSGINEVRFYVDYEFRYNDTIEPHEWVYDERAILFHRHTLNFKVIDFAGNAVRSDLDIWYFNF